MEGKPGTICVTETNNVTYRGFTELPLWSEQTTVSS